LIIYNHTSVFIGSLIITLILPRLLVSTICRLIPMVVKEIVVRLLIIADGKS